MGKKTAALSKIFAIILFAAAGAVYCISVPGSSEYYTYELSRPGGSDTNNVTDESQRGLFAGEASDDAGHGETVAEARDLKSSPINLNTADNTELQLLSGIGASRAEAIIEYRDTIGGFAAKEDIMQVPGIKEGIYNKIKDYIYVEQQALEPINDNSYESLPGTEDKVGDESFSGAEDKVGDESLPGTE